MGLARRQVLRHRPRSFGPGKRRGIVPIPSPVPRRRRWIYMRSYDRRLRQGAGT